MAAQDVVHYGTHIRRHGASRCSSCCQASKFRSEQVLWVLQDTTHGVGRPRLSIHSA
jgi:hypothetical protein